MRLWASLCPNHILSVQNISAMHLRVGVTYCYQLLHILLAVNWSTLEKSLLLDILDMDNYVSQKGMVKGVSPFLLNALQVRPPLAQMRPLWKLEEIKRPFLLHSFESMSWRWSMRWIFGYLVLKTYVIKYNGSAFIVYSQAFPENQYLMVNPIVRF